MEPITAATQPPVAAVQALSNGTGFGVNAHHLGKRANSLVGFPFDASAAASSAQSSFAWQKDRALSSQLSMQFSNNDSMLASNITTTCSSFALGPPSAATPVIVVLPNIAVTPSCGGAPPSPPRNASPPESLTVLRAHDTATTTTTSPAAQHVLHLDPAASEAGEDLGTTKPFVDLDENVRPASEGNEPPEVTVQQTTESHVVPDATERDSKCGGGGKTTRTAAAATARPRAFTESRVVSGKKMAGRAQEADGEVLRAVASAPFTPASSINDEAAMRRVPVAVRVGVERGQTLWAAPTSSPTLMMSTAPFKQTQADGCHPTDSALSAVAALLPVLQQASEEVGRLCDAIRLESQRRCETCLKASVPPPRGDSSGRSPSSRSVSTSANASGPGTHSATAAAAMTTPAAAAMTTPAAYVQLSLSASPCGAGLSTSPGCGSFGHGSNSTGLQRSHPRTTSIEFLPDEALMLCGSGGGGPGAAQSPCASRGDVGSRSGSCSVPMAAVELSENFASRTAAKKSNESQRGGLIREKEEEEEHHRDLPGQSLAFQTTEVVKALAEVAAASEFPGTARRPPPPPPQTAAVPTVQVGWADISRRAAWPAGWSTALWPPPSMMSNTAHLPVFQGGLTPPPLAPYWLPSASLQSHEAPMSLLQPSAVGFQPWASPSYLSTPWACGASAAVPPQKGVSTSVATTRSSGAVSIAVGGSAVSISPCPPTAAEQMIYAAGAQYFATSLAWRFETELRASENWWARHSRAPKSVGSLCGVVDSRRNDEAQSRSTAPLEAQAAPTPQALARPTKAPGVVPSDAPAVADRQALASLDGCSRAVAAAATDKSVVQALSCRVRHLESNFAALRSVQASHGKIIKCADEFEQCLYTRRELGAQKATVYESLESGGGLVGPITDKLRELDGSGATLTIHMQELTDAMQQLSHDEPRAALPEGGTEAPLNAQQDGWDACLHPAAAAGVGLLHPPPIARAVVFAEEWNRICTPFVLRQNGLQPTLSPKFQASCNNTLPPGCAMVIFVFPEAQRTPASLMLRFVENVRQARGLAQPLHFVSQSHSYSAAWVPLDEALAWSHLVLQIHLQRCSPSTLPFADLLRTMRTYLYLPSLMMTTAAVCATPNTTDDSALEHCGSAVATAVPSRGGGREGSPPALPQLVPSSLSPTASSPVPQHRVILFPPQVQPKPVSQFWQMHLCTRSAHGGIAPLEMLAMGIGRLVGVLPAYMESVCTPTKSLNVWVPLRGRDAWMAWTTHIRSAVDAQGVLLGTTAAGPEQTMPSQQQECLVGNHHGNSHSSVTRHWPGFEEVVLARKRNRTRCSTSRSNDNEAAKNPAL